ncbi:hypothetical protein PINS_up000967 [Pythium insidiosum]|nr:hypothetical protein PINS_up000967 [Pythium insidiosum]
MTSAVSAVLDRLHAFKSEHQYLGRYSVDKMLAFERYHRTATWLRVALVICTTPVPTIIALLLMDAVPLNDPALGPAANSVAFVRSILSHAAMTFITMLPLKQALHLDDKLYSFRRIAAISLCVSLTVESVTIPLAFFWCFPVPFREAIAVPVWSLVVPFYHFLLARKMVRRHHRRLALYVPIVGVQIFLFYVFLVLSISFSNVSSSVQIAMILIFPAIKVMLKRLLWRYARRLDDISTDVTVCMVEVSGSLYQTVCVQYASSTWLSVVIMLTDAIQAIIEVQMYTKMKYLADGQRTLTTARTIIDSATIVGRDERPTREGDPARSSENLKKRSQQSSRRWSMQDLLINRDAAGEEDTSASGAPPRRASAHLESVFLNRTQLERNSAHKQLLRFDTDDDEVKPDATYPQSKFGAVKRLQSFQLWRRRPHGHRSVPRRLERRSTTRESTNKQRQSSLMNTLLRLGTSRGKSNSKIVPTTGGFDCLENAVPMAASDPTPTLDTSRSGIYASTTMPHTQPTTSVASTSRASELSLPVVRSMGVVRRQRTSSSAGAMVDGVMIKRREQARVLEQSLQLLFSCEVLLFVEYMEVVIPLLYALAVGIEWILPNAKYNLVVAGMTQHEVSLNVATSFGYGSLELVSMALMFWFVRQRYGISSLYQLAFVLEQYWMTLHGKLVGAFIVVVLAATRHQGTDFSFSFAQCGDPHA